MLSEAVYFSFRWSGSGAAGVHHLASQDAN